MLVIGNAYFHKNRLFALRVTDQLHKAHGWDGIIVFAGDKPDTGSSTDEERDFLREHRELGAKVIDLPRVTDAERRWLYRNAVLVLFPTLYEGFGLVPFEAAAAGSPCVYSSRSSVAEFLPPDGALLDLSDVAETTRRLHDVLKSDEARNTIVQAIRRAGSDLTWSRAADSYLNVYRRSMSRPVGFQLVLGREVVVGTRAQMVSSPTERRILIGTEAKRGGASDRGSGGRSRNCGAPWRAAACALLAHRASLSAWRRGVRRASSTTRRQSPSPARALAIARPRRRFGFESGRCLRQTQQATESATCAARPGVRATSGRASETCTLGRSRPTRRTPSC